MLPSFDRQPLHSARFYAIFDLNYAPPHEAQAICHAMLEGGVDCIQLRGKNTCQQLLLELAKQIQPIVLEKKGIFIVNDYPEIARESQAHGVHIGQEDGSVSQARNQLHPGQWVGKSTHSLAQALAAEKEKPDYIGVGPLYATPTKPDYQPVGLQLIGQIKAKIQTPAFCIGGVSLERLPEILAAGAERVVLVSSILQNSNITSYCRSIRDYLDDFFA